MEKFFRSLIIAAILIIGMVVFHYLGWLKPVESLFVRVISPAQSVVYSFSSKTGSFYDHWLTRRDLLAENKNLRQRLERALIDKSKLSALEDENQLLKDELGFVGEREIQYLSAKIISGVADPLSKSVMINKGSSDGIRKGLAVAAGQGVMIGKVIKVYPYHSKVLLLTDNESLVAATIQNYEQTAGLVEGEFGLSLQMTDIPKDQEVNEGDLVVTSGLEGDIPKNLLIAEIESVKEVESEIFKEAFLRPIISFDNLSYVLVLIP